MDFLKTLLLYMTVTMAVGVQNGPLPQDVPTPTVQVQQEETPAPEGTEIPALQVELPDVPTPTPAPTEVPSPTITPNKAYSNLQYGDRGNGVRRLQERLIELGYLPEGSADGAFGYQTARAVRAFQEANGLYRDGVAGMATQTRLFEDPDVVPAVTPAPEATDTPEPVQTPEPETEPVDDVGTIAPPDAADEEAEPEEPAAAPQPEAEETQPEAEEPAANELGLTQVEGAAIVLGGSSSPLAALRLSDGVMIPFSPRLWLNAEGAAVISLRDMAESVSTWVLQVEENVFTLSAAGYTVVFTATEEGVACAVDGEEVALETGDALCDGADVYVTEGFLRQALGAQTRWDADEHTLMLDVPDKEAAQAND